MVKDGLVSLADASRLLTQRAYKALLSRVTLTEDFSLPLSDLIVFVVSSQLQDGKQLARRLAANQLIASFASIIEVYRFHERIFCIGALMDLPLLETATGKFRKVSREYKMEVLEVVAREPSLRNAGAAMAGRRLWGMKTAAAQSKKRANYKTWDADVLFAHLSSGWALFPKTGPICMSTDAVRLSGEDTSFYNFLDPLTDESCWSPIQVVLYVLVCSVRRALYPQL